MRYGWNATCYQILNPGISLWFSRDGAAVVGYVTAHGYRIIAGEPVCDPARLAAVSTAFEADTRQAGQRVCYFGSEDRMILILEQRPMAGILLGAQPVWIPQLWGQRIARKASLRAQLARARNKHVTISAWPPERATNHPALQRCLDQWLQTRRLPPLHFLVEPYTLGLLVDRRVWVAERQGQVVGFLVASPIPQRHGWLIEQNIRGLDAPNGTTELLLATAMRDLSAAGASYVTLGLSPLSRRAGIAQTPQPPLVQAALAVVQAYGQYFYNFAGLDTYKAKFLPDWWEPIYAITQGQRMSLHTLYAIAEAFGSTSPVLLMGRGVLRMVLYQVQRHAPPLGRRLKQRQVRR